MKSILIAEDDQFLVKVYQKKFVDEGYDVVVAKDGEEATKLIRDTKPDLILLDLIMPIKDGYEVMATIKKDRSLNKIPIIVMSNLDSPEDKSKSKDLGAKEYIVKSNIELNDFVEIVKKHLS